MHSELESEVSQILKSFAQSWSLDLGDLNRPSSEKLLDDLIEKAPESLRARLNLEFRGPGPIHELLDDPGILEIIINGRQDIWFEKEGAFSKLTDTFLSDLTFKNFVDRVCAEAGLKVDLAQPFVDGHWRGFRLHLVCAPLSHCAFHMTLRRTPKNPWTLEKLLHLNWAKEKQIEILRSLIVSRKNILILGPTGSGKTSVLGACLKELCEEERVLILEDTSELPIPNSASTKLLTRNSSAALNEVNLSDLVCQSLRMRPARLVVGEVRGGESKDLLLALATGHSGSFGTLHAASAKQALLRLEMLIQLGAPQWNVQAIRQLIHLSVDVLVVCGIENGNRQLEGIFKLAALESFGFLLEPLT